MDLGLPEQKAGKVWTQVERRQSIAVSAADLYWGAGGEAKGLEGWQTAAPVQDPKAKLWTPIAPLQQGP